MTSSEAEGSTIRASVASLENRGGMWPTSDRLLLESPDSINMPFSGDITPGPVGLRKILPPPARVVGEAVRAVAASHLPISR